MSLKNLRDLLVLVEVVEPVSLLLKAPERDLFYSRILLQRNYLEVSGSPFFRIFINPPILNLIVEVVCL